MESDTDSTEGLGDLIHRELAKVTAIKRLEDRLNGESVVSLDPCVGLGEELS